MREMSALNDHHAAKAAEFYKRYYGQLEGARIVSFKGMASGFGEDVWDTTFPVFSVRLANGKLIKIEISQDEEGNGGGFIFGLDWVDMSDWTTKLEVTNA